MIRSRSGRRTFGLTLALLGAAGPAYAAGPPAASAAPPSPAPTPAASPAASPGSSPASSSPGESATAVPPAAAPATNAEGGTDPGDPTEDPRQRYYYVGLRYRGTIFPSFLLSAFVREARGFYFNTVGAEVDIRKDGFSFIPSISYSEYGTDDVLFADKTRPLDNPANWGLANSSMKSLNLTVDFMWSVPVHKTLDFEYGLGAGAGITFGDLVVNWVYRDDANGPLRGSDGHGYRQCNTQADATSCQVAAHENATTARVGRYTEPSWLSGGAKPSILPYLSIPQLGVRFHPIKKLVTRATVGITLTGFWFGLSANYGL